MRFQRLGLGVSVSVMVMLTAFSGVAPAQGVAAMKIPAAPAARVANPRMRSLDRSITRSLDDEVQVVAPGGPVMLAQEFELRLVGETGLLSRISVTQWVEAADGQWREVYQGFSSGQGERRGDAVVMKLAPYEVGRVQLRVTGSGKTGDELEMMHKDVWVEVAPPATGPVELRFGQDGQNAWGENESRVVTRRIGLNKSLNLAVEAKYAGVLELQAVNAQEVQYRVRSGVQAISLDSRTGMVRGVKAGAALVEASYGGVTKTACVVVGGSDAAGCGKMTGR